MKYLAEAYRDIVRKLGGNQTRTYQIHQRVYQTDPGKLEV